MIDRKQMHDWWISLPDFIFFRLWQLCLALGWSSGEVVRGVLHVDVDGVEGKRALAKKRQSNGAKVSILKPQLESVQSNEPTC